MSTCLRLFLRQKVQDQTDKTLYFFFQGGVLIFFLLLYGVGENFRGEGNIRGGGKKLIRLVYISLSLRLQCKKKKIFIKNKKILKFSSKNETFLQICKRNRKVQKTSSWRFFLHQSRFHLDCFSTLGKCSNLLNNLRR